MSDYCDTDKAQQDAEWLAGSEADTAERNLARAFLQLRMEVEGFTAMWEAREQAHDAELTAHHARIVAAWKGMQGSEPDESPEGRPCMYETEHGDWVHRVDFADKLATLDPNGGA